MTTDIKFTDDISIENGDLAVVESSQAAGQRIRHRLLTFRGEWFLDLEFGPPYREQILVKNPPLDIIGAIIRSEIIKSQPGEFMSFEASLNNATRSLKVDATMITTEGTVDVNISVP